MVVAEAPHRIKFWSPDLKRIAYKTWDEMSLEERAYIRDKKPELLPGAERTAGEPGRFADLIDEFTSRLDAYKQVKRTAQSPKERIMAEWAITEYQLALEVLGEAEQVPEGEEAQFCVYPGGAEFQTRIPPRHDEDERSDDTLLRFMNHVLRTNKPIAIAWLRRMIRDGHVEGLYEVELGQYPALAKDSLEFIGYVSHDAYHKGVAAGSYAR